jgi:predicted house-cleaning noncanonical NTP pyrophosphatase (MazG superfamily)
MSGEYPPDAEYNKLVRDGIPEIIRESGLGVETKELSQEEIVKELLKKVVEEATELSEAEGSEEIAKEMSDVLEVLHSLSERLGISMEEVEQLRQLRAAKRGRFEKGTFLIRTYEGEK